MASVSRTASRTTLAGKASAAAGVRVSATSVLTARNGGVPLPSKHRLISARSSAVGFSGTSCTVATANPVPDGNVYIVNAVNARGALSVSYTRDQKLLAVGETSGDVRVFRTGKPDELCCLSLRMAVEGRRAAGTASGAGWGGRAVAVTCLRPWPAPAEPAQPTLLAGYADGRIRLWDVRHGTILREVSEERQCLGLAVSPDFLQFVSLGDDGAVHLYDSETGRLVSKLVHSGFSDAVDGHKSRTFSGAFHPLDAHGLVTGGWDNLLQFWDTRLAQSVRHAGETHIGGSEALDISQDGREVLSCSWRNTDQLQTWDYGTAKRLETIHPDRTQSYLYAGRYLSENLICCGGAGANLFRLVHIGQQVTLGAVTGLAHGIYSIALGPVGARYHLNPSLNNGKNMLPHSKDKCPRVAFCSHSKVVELEVF